MVNPVSANAQATQTVTNGKTSAGFGWINTASVLNPPRNGTLVARFQFCGSPLDYSRGTGAKKSLGAKVDWIL
jgi:hypothetical protein